MPDTRRYGRVQVDDDGLIRAFEEKGEAGQGVSHRLCEAPEGPFRQTVADTFSGCINAGVYLLGRQVLTAIPEQAAVSLERATFPAWLGRGLYGCLSERPFLDIGTPDSYAAAKAFFSVDHGYMVPGAPMTRNAP